MTLFLIVCTRASYFDAEMRKAGVGFEPTNRGFAIRSAETRQNIANDGSGKGLRLADGGGENSRAENAPKIDPDLSAVLTAWPTLAEPIKAGIAAMIGAARQARGEAKGPTGGQ